MKIQVFNSKGEDITHLFRWTLFKMDEMPRVVRQSIHNDRRQLALNKLYEWMDRYNADKLVYQICVEAGIPPVVIERPGNKR